MNSDEKINSFMNDIYEYITTHEEVENLCKWLKMPLNKKKHMQFMKDLYLIWAKDRNKINWYFNNKVIEFENKGRI